MKHSNFLWSSMILVCGILLAGCTENPDENQVPVNPITRSVADKNVAIATYVDVTTTNPLNAGLYRMGDATFLILSCFMAAISVTRSMLQKYV